MQPTYIPKTALVSQEQLVKLLSEAFNAGLGGYEDLRQDTVESIAQRFFEFVAAEANRIAEESRKQVVMTSHMAVGGVTVGPASTGSVLPSAYYGDSNSLYINPPYEYQQATAYERNGSYSVVQTNSYVSGTTFSGPNNVNYQTHSTVTGVSRPSISVGAN